MQHAVGIIPARFASSRFPGKPLAPLKGKPLIQHVWERSVRAGKLDRVVVATDDERIRQAVVSFGGEALLTSPDHLTGTDRVQEAVRKLESSGATIDVVLNIQGDEALVEPEVLDRLAATLMDNPELDYATMAEPFSSIEEILDPNTCKVVLDQNGDALYFSRSPIPFHRKAATGGIADLAEALRADPDRLKNYHRQVGIYGFKRKALDEFAALPKGRLEEIEGLEQLRIIEAGRRIRVVLSSRVTMDVDLPGDVKKVESLLAEDSLVNVVNKESR
jgi:3-deoxy-manno-octulosonate cytidylyltransferase (CMP-KDO synthetase)